MSIQSIGTVQASDVFAPAETLRHTSEASSKTIAADSEPAAVYSKSESIDAGTYTKDGARALAVAEALKAAEKQRMATLTSAISTLFQKQSVFGATASGKVELSYDFLSSLNVNAVTAQEASSAIAVDGEWGVNAVATRVMDMALALSGGDSDKASVLKAAVLKGFDEATTAWGRELPEISQKTKSELLTRFDYWQKNGSMEGYEAAAASIENQ